MAATAAIERDISAWADAAAARADSLAIFAPALAVGGEFAWARMPSPAPARPPFAALAISLAAHGALFAALALFSWSPRPLDGVVEIPVEIVAEAPSPPAVAEPPAPVEPSPPPAAAAPATPVPAAVSEPAAPTEPSPPPPVETPRAATEPAPPPAAVAAPAPVEAATPPPPPRTQPRASLEPTPQPQPTPRPRHAAAAVRPAPGPAASRAGSPGADADAYRASLYARIYAAVRYPESARERGAEGVAVVSFSFDARGQVTSATLAQSSGDAALDAEAVASVRRASPLPPPPEGAPRAYAIPLRYRLR
ncbi:MAG: energy transducer TonB [Roseiarcus sp.]